MRKILTEFGGEHTSFNCTEIDDALFHNSLLSCRAPLFHSYSTPTEKSCNESAQRWSQHPDLLLRKRGDGEGIGFPSRTIAPSIAPRTGRGAHGNRQCTSPQRWRARSRTLTLSSGSPAISHLSLH